MLEYTDKLPDDIELSKFLNEKANGYFVVILHGMKYYIPLIKEMRQIFKIKIVDGHIQSPASFKGQQKIFHILQYIIDAVYLQMRDTVGGEVYGKLDRNIKDGLEKMYTNILQQTIIGGMNNKMLPEKNEDK